MKELVIARKLLPFLRIYPWSGPTVVVLGVISSLAEGLGISLLIPFLTSLEEKQLDPDGVHSSLLFFYQLLEGVNPTVKPFAIATFIVGTILLKVLFAYLCTLQVNWLNSRIIHRLRCKAFNQLMNLGQEFWDGYRGGDILNTLNQQILDIGEAINYFIWMVVNLCMIATFTAFLLIISWPLTLLAALVLGLISFLVKRLTYRMEAFGERSLTADIHLQRSALEAINGIRTIRAFGREGYTQNQFSRVSKQVRDATFRREMLLALVEPVFEGLAVVLLVGLMLITVWTSISLPVLITMIFMLYRLQPQVKQLDFNRTNLLAVSSSLAKLRAFLDTTDKPYIHSGAVPYGGLKDGITLRSVSFTYDAKDSHALQDVSMTIRRGETTALVGPSGSGKSTLISLICRFYDLSDGQIEVDGQPIASLALADWRNSIALVSQDIYIFSTTIADNIAYGRMGATRTDIIAAAKQANAHDFICKLPKGYDTLAGDQGVRLSGGQKQRIAIARAILREPDILILDEATNALDSLSENLIQDALYRLSQGRTVIIIAHRLSTIEHADQIVVFKDGQIAESGTFADLLSKQGLFSQMYQVQNKHSPYLQV